jgi:hypothetical protein
MSCMDKKEKKLTGYFGGKYWDLTNIGNRYYKKPRYSCFFSKSGDYHYYVYNVSENNETKTVRVKFDYGDVIYPEKWYFENDSIINIQSFRYRVLKLTEKYFKIQNIEESSDIVVYQLSPQQ